jgi:NAD(P)-dependent dehydrogenase (short-subunit alcohol dehydrogenase family)
MERTALVTGANRGIGFEVCRQLARAGARVVLTARDAAAGNSAAARLRAEGLDILFEELDVSRDESVRGCAKRLQEAGERVTILVNNAAIYPTDALLGAEAPFRDTMEINFFGAVRACRAFVPGMIEAGYGRIVNVSSGCGSFSSGLRCDAAYSISKAALNAFTVKLASELNGDVKVNAGTPGWVRTRMGGATAPKSVEEGADTIVWLATLPKGGPNGGFFQGRKKAPW